VIPGNAIVIRHATDLSDGRVAADPFAATAQLVELLRLFTPPVPDGDGSRAGMMR
jgi:hypothetical protein